MLAEHFERGGEPWRASGWYQRAAEQALEGDDLAAAIELAAKIQDEKGRTCFLEAIPENAETLALARTWRSR